VSEFIGGIFFTLVGAALVVTILRRRRHRRLERRGAATAEMNGQLTQLTRELAHELKNPLSTVKVNLALTREALEEVAGTDDREALSDRRQHELARALRKIAIVQKETDRLEYILDGFLRYVREPDLQLVTMDVNELIGDMIDFYSPQAHKRNLTVRQTLADRPLICRVDPSALKQVLLNLFINAQQAMDEGGELMIRTASRGQAAAIEISDTGTGIPPEELSQIFRPYYSSRPGGSGLGLATAKKLVEAHGGSISVHSEPGKGTWFTIEFPLAHAEAKSSEVSA
jgi:signal transduction histidine kinase